MAYLVQTNHSIKIMNSVSYKRITKTNYSGLVKMNRNTVLEILDSFYSRNKCESINYSYYFSYNPFRLIPIIAYSLQVINVKHTHSIKQITCALCTRSWLCPKKALFTLSGLCTESWPCITSTVCNIRPFLVGLNKHI